MESFNGDILDSLPIDLNWEMEIYGYEGPLLYQSRSSDGRKYFHYWCDCDDKHDRWMLFPVSERVRARYLSRKASLKETITQSIRDFVFFQDTGDKLSNVSAYLVQKRNIPASYYPDSDSYLDTDIDLASAEPGSLSILFDNEDWDVELVRNYSRNFRQAYDFLLGNLTGEVVKVPNLPWRGGFSSMHFFEKLKNIVDSDRAVDYRRMDFASPGLLKLDTDSEASLELFRAVAHYSRNKATIDKARTALTRRITDLGLNQLEKNAAFAGFAEDEELPELYSEFISVIEHGKYSKQIEKGRTLFESAKIMLAQQKRIKFIYDHISDESVTIAQWASSLQTSQHY